MGGPRHEAQPSPGCVGIPRPATTGAAALSHRGVGRWAAVCGCHVRAVLQDGGEQGQPA